MSKKRFYLLYSQLGSGTFVDREEKIKSIIVDKEFQKIGLLETLDLLNELAEENKQLREENNLLKNSEAVTDQKELQKLLFGTIINLIDEKIKKYQSKPSKLAVLKELKEELPKE